MSTTAPTRLHAVDPILRFEEREYSDRRDRARRAMHVRGIGAAVFTDSINVAYFTGITTPSYVIRSRPVLLVLGADGSDALICSAGHVPYFSTLWDGAIDSYGGLESSAADALVDGVVRLAATGSAIALELGPEQRFNLSFALLDGMRDRWGRERVVDASEVLWATRMLKSADEIEAIRRSNLVNHESLDVALAEAAEHRTEVGTYRRWLAEVAARGADGPHYLAMHTAPLHRDWINSAPTDRRIETGEILWMDGGPTVGGYWSDVTRTVAFDELDSDAEQAYALAREATSRLIAAIRPGVLASDVFAATAEFLESEGQTVNRAGRVGHGIGLQLTEEPSLAAFDHTVLEEGMVLAVEPVVTGSGGRFAVEENLVVTEGGTQLLSVACPERIPVL
ncbi:MAG: aminopeptidase P family protein [Microbacteriaceae bacterium]|nr:aminopeptidase P family protein [Microbacteriaceae bacterium]